MLFATPAQQVRSVAKSLIATKTVRPATPVLITAKGIELGTSKLMSEILAEEMPQHGIAILSGPSFATEVTQLASRRL